MRSKSSSSVLEPCFSSLKADYTPTKEFQRLEAFPISHSRLRLLDLERSCGS